MKKLTECNVENCPEAAQEGSDKCILHCVKADYSTDWNKPGFLKSFYEKLIDYIAEETFSYKKEAPDINRAKLKEFLHEENNHESVAVYAKESTVVLSNIAFPSRDSRDRFDYLKVLQKLGAIHFNYCSFRVYGMELVETKCFYQDCEFHDKWHVYNTPILESVNNVLFQHCTFHEEVFSSPEGDDQYEMRCQLFNNCDFRKGVEFDSIIFNAPVFNNTNKEILDLVSLRIRNCTLKEKFILNRHRIGLFRVEDSVFESKVEFKENIVGEFDVFNTNHLKLVDTYKTKYKKFIVKKSIYDDFVGFERCEFGKAGEVNPEYMARFVYATFLSFINFRNTIFTSGLDIKNINLKESPNFLGTEINPTCSNRETFRIIKSSFDKSGNYIEANKYFAYEMRKHKEDLKGSGKHQEQIILFLNEKISNYGQSYTRPLLLMVAAAFVYYFLVLGYESNTLYNIHPSLNSFFKVTSDILNGVSENVLPFKRMLKEGMEFVSLVFYVIFASLIWQTLVAIKRHTKR